MILSEGLYDVAAGHIATVITHLEMQAPFQDVPKPFPDGVAARGPLTDLDTYRALFKSVGAPWLWTSRLLLDDAGLGALLNDPLVECWAIRQGDTNIGLIELDFRTEGACELVLFGLVAQATGQGLGGPMITFAQARAAARGVDLFTLKTCHLDDPRALGFYQRAGFTPVKRSVEVFADPRLNGPHDPATAPHVPCLS